MFSQVAYGTSSFSVLNQHGNFQTFGRAMMTLVRAGGRACV